MKFSFVLYATKYFKTYQIGDYILKAYFSFLAKGLVKILIKGIHTIFIKWFESIFFNKYKHFSYDRIYINI